MECSLYEFCDFDLVLSKTEYLNAIFRNNGTKSELRARETKKMAR